ncbi:MAG: hypothetical protein HY558_00885 [Euryarchaeota archaeon]|nr:hypothetical protein [Euryarchaeota archaeon]
MKCTTCGGPLREIDFSRIPEIHHEPKRHGRAYECAKCGDIELDAGTSVRLRRELRPRAADKAIKKVGP